MLNVSGVPPLDINEFQYELTVSSVQFSHLNVSKELKTTTLDLSVLIFFTDVNKKASSRSKRKYLLDWLD